MVARALILECVDLRFLSPEHRRKVVSKRLRHGVYSLAFLTTHDIEGLMEKNVSRREEMTEYVLISMN